MKFLPLGNPSNFIFSPSPSHGDSETKSSTVGRSSTLVGRVTPGGLPWSHLGSVPKHRATLSSPGGSPWQSQGALGVSPCLANMVPKPQPTPPRNDPRKFLQAYIFPRKILHIIIIRTWRYRNMYRKTHRRDSCMKGLGSARRRSWE